MGSEMTEPQYREFWLEPTQVMTAHLVAYNYFLRGFGLAKWYTHENYNSDWYYACMVPEHCSHRVAAMEWFARRWAMQQLRREVIVMRGGQPVETWR
jgi:hypothetical protein